MVTVYLREKGCGTVVIEVRFGDVSEQAVWITVGISLWEYSGIETLEIKFILANK